MHGARWRFRLGTTLFVVGFGSPLLIPLVTASTLPPGWKATLAGLLAVGIPELFTIVAVAVMGKEGFQRLKSTFRRALDEYGPAQHVSLARYRIGLALLLAPLLFAWISPYLGRHIPGYESRPLALAIAGDALLVSSLFVLGGEFWDKLRSLFHHGATAVFPG
jgi:hypothetical protein